MGLKLNKSQSWMFTKYRNVSPDIEMICENDKYENTSGDNHRPGIQTSIDDIYYTHVNWSMLVAQQCLSISCIAGDSLLFEPAGKPILYWYSHFFLKFSQIIIFMDITD